MTELEQAGKNFLAEIENYESLAPSDTVNDIFSRFVGICLHADATPTDEKLITKCSDACAKAEVEMERFWADKIIHSEHPEQTLHEFWYFENYEKLSKLDFLNAQYFCGEIKNILFLGSGPLPLTAILLAKQGIHITLVDYEKKAVDISTQLVQALNMQDCITIICEDAADFRSETPFDLVYGASLLFQSEKNTKLLKNISNISTKYFLLRTSHRGRKLLYRPIPRSIIQTYFSPQILIHPKNDIVNSFIIVTKK